MVGDVCVERDTEPDEMRRTGAEGRLLCSNNSAGFVLTIQTRTALLYLCLAEVQIRDGIFEVELYR